MIPLLLELRNFLAYREPGPLDFSGLHVAVLTGENGAGKSSLLDAITWCLWGKARGRRDDELVHQGAAEMRVALNFELSGQVYRVTRTKRAARGSGGTTVLDLQLQAADGRWAPIGESGVSPTQAKIISLLGLTYDTFINSAYIIQGRADEFTGKKPTERKQVLADILRLQQWERYEERAKKRIKDIDAQLHGLEAVLAEIERELTRRPEYVQELTAAQARVIQTGEGLRQAEVDWSQGEAARQSLLAVQRQLDDLDRRRREALAEQEAVDKELVQARALADTAGLAGQIAAAEQALRLLDQQEAERDRLTVARQANAELCGQLKGQNESAESLGKSLKDRQSQLDEEARLANERTLTAAQQEADKLRRRVASLETATEPVCPTCGQALGPDQRAGLMADLTAEAEACLARARAEARERDERRAKAADELKLEIEAHRAVYRQNRDRLKALTEEQAGQDRDLLALAAALKQKPVLTERLGQLRTTLGQAGAAQDRIQGLLERRARWQQSLEADQAAQVKLAAEAAELRAIVQGAEARQRALDQLRKDDALAKARLGAAEQKLRALDGQELQREAKRAERQAAAEARGVYDELREAFGKKGVPAMIIEAAVPEIEAAANRLLARITDGRMTVRFRSQRETQAGEVRETLEIDIGDELGTRPYESFSGGEQFRVNFAVRLALSQLLAHRAGTKLHTLFIDEGFGVLDAVGRERLVEAINAIHDDFRRVLVVTHIDELKDAFPARIEVTKTPQGSQITLV